MPATFNNFFPFYFFILIQAWYKNVLAVNRNYFRIIINLYLSITALRDFLGRLCNSASFLISVSNFLGNLSLYSSNILSMQTALYFLNYFLYVYCTAMGF